MVDIAGQALVGQSVGVSDWHSFIRLFQGSGINPDAYNEFEVYADSTGMQVKVKSGEALVAGQRCYSAGEEIIPISVSDPANDRIDVIVLRRSLTAGTREIDVLTGVAAAVPVAPVLTVTNDVYEFALAEILIDAAAVTIAAGKVTDSRTYLSFGGGGDVYTATAEGRLTLESGVPVSTSDQSAKTTLYYTPYMGNQIALYDGASDWELIEFTELSITLVGLTASKPYDVFVYNNGGVATLELLVWTDGTNRATALAYQDGVLVKSGATTRRYVGTIYINSTGGQSDDAVKARFVWNAYNKTFRHMTFGEATASWTYATSTTWRQMRGTAANKVEFIVGLPEVFVEAMDEQNHSDPGSGFIIHKAIGLDSTSVPSTFGAGSYDSDIGAKGYIAYHTAHYHGFPGIGYHYLAPLEYQVPGNTVTWYGSGYAICQHVFYGGLLG